MKQSLTKYKFHIRGISICLLSMIVYYVVCAHLYVNVSPHWVWALYLSPIFFVAVTLFSMFYVCINQQQQTQSDSEQDFCITVILLTVMLIWWPIFIIIYLQVFQDVLIPFESASGGLTSSKTLTYYDEIYEVLIYNVSGIEAYGCLSNLNEASLTTYPLPYKYYELGDFTKLPSWFCNPIDSEILTDFFISVNNFADNMKIITFNYPNYISKSFWIGFIATIFQLVCIFSSILLMAILLIIDQKPIESAVRKPSRKRRILSYILSFILYMFMISCNNLIITVTSLAIGIAFLLWSFMSKIHNHFYQMIQGMFKMATSKILLIPITLIAFILITIYIAFILIVSQCVFHFKIFLCRHYVALWKGKPEEPLDDYDQFINRMTILTWVWNIVLIILLSTLQIDTVPMILTLILCTIQLINIPIVLMTTKTTNIIEQPWKIYYTQYKIIQQCTDQENEGQHNRNGSPMEVKEIELQLGNNSK